MKFHIKNNNLSLTSLFREIGYKPLGPDNAVRPVRGQRYPRFHIYFKEEGDNIIINLHLDQKRPSYGKHTAHSGEYEGEIVDKEAKRIQSYI